MEEGKPERRVTLADVGKKTGYHFSTVAYALKGHPSIPEKTRAKIRKAAKEMGYAPDPTLSSLIAYRKNKGARSYKTTIAVISDSDKDAAHWRNPDKKHFASEYWMGMSERASELGYRLEEFSVGLDRRNEGRLNRILQTRGITAVIVAPLFNLHDPIQLDWDRFSAIAIGYSLKSPSLPRITHQHRAAMQIAVLELFKLGYRKLGLMLPQEYDERVDFAWSSGFYGTSARIGKLNNICAYMPEDTPEAWEASSLKWLEEHKPDAIITPLAHYYDYLIQAGINIPGDLGFARMDLNSSLTFFSGVDQNSFTIGRDCINLLSNFYINNIRGIPAHKQIHLIRGFWNSGQTTRKVNR